jgi:hypothetical protein
MCFNANDITNLNCHLFEQFVRFFKRWVHSVYRMLQEQISWHDEWGPGSCCQWEIDGAAKQKESEE